MIEAEARIRRALGRLELAYPDKAGAAWDRRRREVWLGALKGCDPEMVEAGADRLIASWTALKPPAPGNLREHVDAAAARMSDGPLREEAGRTPNRCPECHGAKLVEAAVVDRNGIASCVNGLHRTAWRVT